MDQTERRRSSSFLRSVIERHNEGKSMSETERAVLAGWLQFPRNHRAARLRAKQFLNQATPEETALLVGFNAFPENDEAASLVAKKRTEGTTPDEQTKLDGFYSERLQELLNKSPASYSA